MFKNLSLETKIKYNKCLEESCGILYILPNILLGKYYNLMLDLIKIKIPNEDKFLPKFIENEISTLISNNSLLKEVNIYFNKSFEVYLILSKEKYAKNNYLKEKEYFQTFNYFEKLRYNIMYLNNSFYNAETNYNEDISAINKLINSKNQIENNIINSNNNDDINNELYKEELKKTMKKNNNLIEKIENQFILRKNPDDIKRYRIESALGILKEKKPQYNYLGHILKNQKKMEYKSIFDNKYFDKLLNHCYKDAKEKIITQKITNEMDLGKRKKRYQTLKINFG